VTLGVGRGYQPAMFSAFNVSRREKREIFSVCLETMLKAWSGEPVSVADGTEPVTVNPQPVQKPHPPIWVAAFGPKALAQAGTLGLPYIASPMEPIERLRDNYQRHADACEGAGRALPAEVPIMRSIFVSSSRRSVSRVRDLLEQQAREMASSGIRKGMSLGVDDWALVGDVASVKDGIQRYREELGMSHLIVTRLRIGRVDAKELESSVAAVAEAVG